MQEQTNFALLATVGVDPRTQRLFLLVNGDSHSVVATQTHEYVKIFVGALAAIVRSPEQVVDLGTNDATDRDVTQRCVRPGRFRTRQHHAAVRRSIRGRPAYSGLRRCWPTCSPRCSAWTPSACTTISSPSAVTRFLPSSCAARLRSVVSLSISRTCIARPTIAELAESSSRPAEKPQGVTDAFALLPLIDRAALHDAEDAFPATVLQLGMLFHSIERVDSAMYKDVFRYRVAMPWREKEFTDAFDRLVARHPALRSSFELSQHSAPVQVVRAGVPRAFDIVTGAGDADVEQYMTSRHTQRYDFTCAPLYSLRAFVGNEGVDLVFAFHHAVLDGWSVANLMRELLQDYLFRLGLDVPAIDTEVHSATMLAEQARLERAMLEDPAAQEFWRSALAGSRATSLDSFVAPRSAGGRRSGCDGADSAMAAGRRGTFREVSQGCR